MGTPVLADVSIWIGNNAPAKVWQTPNDFPLGGSVVVLFVSVGGAPLFTLRSDDGASGLTVDGSGHFIAWLPSIEQSRMIPRGRIARYEIERWYLGTQETLAYGALIGVGGDNIDV